MVENSTEFCQQLPILKVPKDVAPDWRDGREERNGTQGICVDNDGNYVFNVPIQGDENILLLFNIYIFRASGNVLPIVYVRTGHL